MRSLTLTLAALALLALSGCKSASTGTTADASSDTYTVSGVAEGGPCNQGSSVTFQDLDSTLAQSGRSFETTTTDDTGAYSLSVQTALGLVDAKVEGYCFHEVKGTAVSPVTLRAYADVSAGQTVHINIATTLERPRIAALVKGGSKFAAAEGQAETEVFAAFGLGVPAKSPKQMSVAVDSTLLALSVLVIGNDDESTYSQRMYQIADDLADGSLDSASLKAAIVANRKVTYSAVSGNLTTRYAKSGKTVTPPSISDYMDDDGDGVLNPVDDDTPAAFAFTAQTGLAASTAASSNTITISGISATTKASLSGSGFAAYKNGTAQTGDFMVTNEDRVSLTGTSSSSYNSTVTATLTVGGTSGTWSLSTFTPSGYSFAAKTGLELSASVTSDSVTLSGYTGSETVTLSGCTATKDGVAHTGTSFSAAAGAVVTLTGTTSSSFGTAQSCTLTLGGVTSTWTYTTYSPVLYGYFDGSAGTFSMNLGAIYLALPLTTSATASVKYMGIGSTCSFTGAYLYSNNGGNPGTLLATATLGYAPALLGSLAYSKNTGGTATLPGGTQASLSSRYSLAAGDYWIVLSKPSACQTGGAGGTSTHDTMKWSNDLSTWTSYGGGTNITLWLAD